mgnify:FL=1
MDTSDYESVVTFREKFRVLLEGLTTSIPSALRPLQELNEEQKIATELLALSIQLGSILQCPALRVDEKTINEYRAALDAAVPGVGDFAASLTVRCLQFVVDYGEALRECEQRGMDEADSPRARMAAIGMARCYSRIVLEFVREVEARLQQLEHPQPWPVGFHL